MIVGVFLLICLVKIILLKTWKKEVHFSGNDSALWMERIDHWIEWRVEGIMNAQLPWSLIFIGVFVAIVIEILGVPVMPVAVGMYLPFSLSAGIMCGGAIRWFVEKRTKKDEKFNKEAVERGTLYTSGLIAGEGLMGILLAVFAVLHWDIDISSKFSIGQIGSLIMWALMLATLLYVCFGKKNLKKIVKNSDVQYDSEKTAEDATDE